MSRPALPAPDIVGDDDRPTNFWAEPNMHSYADACNAALLAACKHYEAALKATFPMGASGQAWEQWNEARKLWEYWK